MTEWDPRRSLVLDTEEEVWESQSWDRWEGTQGTLKHKSTQLILLLFQIFILGSKGFYYSEPQLQVT